MATSELSLREQYLLEKDLIEQEYGGLEGIRLSLGLSQRQLCKILLVDPSAFTRWNKTGGAPPHIYKALKWLLELKEVQPQAVEPMNISSRVDHLQSSTQTKIKQLEEHVESLERALSFDSSEVAKEAIAYALKTQEKNFEQEMEALRKELKNLKKTPAKRKVRKKVRKKTPRKKNVRKKKAKKKKVAKKSVRRKVRKKKKTAVRRKK